MFGLMILGILISSHWMVDENSISKCKFSGNPEEIHLHEAPEAIHLANLHSKDISFLLLLVPEVPKLEVQDELLEERLLDVMCLHENIISNLRNSGNSSKLGNHHR